MDERRDVVRADVEQRAGPFGEQEFRLGWKMSGPGYCMTVCADMGTPMSPWAIARRAVCLLAEHRVWCDAHQEPRGFGLFEECASARAVDADRLLRPHMLARCDRLTGDLRMGGRDGQIHDDLDVGMCQDVVAGAPLGDVVLRLCPCPFLVEVTQDHNPYVGETCQALQVGVADHPRTDEADTTGRILPSPHPMLVEVVHAGLNAIEDVTRKVVELDHGELGGRGSRQAVQEWHFTPARPVAGRER